MRVKSKGGIKLDGLPRMADFAEIAEIACRCMGYKDNEFLDAYDKNIELQIEEAISENLVSNAIVKFMERQRRMARSCNRITCKIRRSSNNQTKHKM